MMADVAENPPNAEGVCELFAPAWRPNRSHASTERSPVAYMMIAVDYER